MTALLEVGAGVGWPDAEAAGAARTQANPQHGRLAELAEWLAGTQGRFPPATPDRPRLAVVGTVSAHAAELASSLDVGVREIKGGDATAGAFSKGASAADDEIEAGADLIALAAVDETPTPAVLVSLLTGTEPVALLPRGADAIDTASWIKQAETLRDTRRKIAQLRARPDELLDALGSPAVAAAAGFALRAAARRTPVVLDGVAAIAAALLCVDIQTRARHWWRVADTSAARTHKRAVEQLEMTPILDLGSSLGDGTAGLLAIQVLRTAALIGTQDE